MDSTGTRNRSTRRRARRLASAVVVGAAGALVAAAGAAPVPGVVSGSVFRDVNSSGARDAGEVGQPGILVRAIGPTGAVLGTQTTLADGRFALPVPDGLAARIELGALPRHLQPGTHGPDSGTSVQFAVSPAEDVGFAVQNPGEFCESNPAVLTNCLVVAPAPATAKAIVKLASGAASRTPATASPGAGDVSATAGAIGATWGLGWDRASKSLFSAAFVKRHTLLGPGGTGGIYRTQPGPNGAIGDPDDVTTLFAQVPNAGANPHPGQHGGAILPDWLIDAAGFRAVGKAGLGDLDVAEDGSALFTVNLATGSLIRVPILPDGTAGMPTATSVPAPESCVDPRPFGLGIRDGQVYVGGVCSAESTQRASDLQGYVMRYDQSDGAFATSPALVFSLAGPRGCADREADALAAATAVLAPDYAATCPADLGAWNPWNDPANEVAVSRAPTHPEPMLVDIAFDRGALVLGIRDRHGDQMGSGNGTLPLAGAPDFVFGIAAGDVLRACPTGADWTIESAGACGGVRSAGATNGQGSGGGEFYFGDFHRSLGEQGLSGGADGGHDEVSFGGLLQVPGAPDVAMTALTPIQGGSDTFSEGGVLWMSNRTGAQTGGYRVYEPDPELVFGKANGLGDLEAACSAAPVEIGNRVWRDLNGNGVQDAGEPPIPGVVVTLTPASGEARTATTDAFGTYYFSVAPETAYTVRIATGQPALAGLIPTGLATGTDRSVDSNGEPGTALVSAAVRSGLAGQNDHSIDFGFGLSGVVVPNPPPSVPGTGTPAPPPVVTAARSRIVVTKSGPATALSGQRVRYRIRVRVPAGAPTAATSVVLRDVLPTGLLLAGQRQNERQVTWSLGTIRPGGSRTVVVDARVGRAVSGTLTNTAIATARNAPRAADGARTRVTRVRSVVPPAVTG